MIHLHVSSKTVKYEAIVEWLEERNSTQLVTIHKTEDAFDTFYYYQPYLPLACKWYDLDFEDEMLAIEFRLAFDAELGVSTHRRMRTFLDETNRKLEEQAADLSVAGGGVKSFFDKWKTIINNASL